MKKFKYGIILIISIAVLVICLSGCCAHEYEETVIPPTCTEEGYTLHECSVCGWSYKSDTVKRKEHIETDWIVDKEETCTENGLKYKECSVCGEKTKTETISKGHNFENNKCTRCGYINSAYPHIELPIGQVVKLNYIAPSGKIYTSCVVQSAKIDDYPQSLLGSYTYSKITFTIKKVYDDKGNAGNSRCWFAYKIYDDTKNLVVESGSVYSSALTVGEATEVTVSLYNLTAGTEYRMELLDYSFA